MISKKSLISRGFTLIEMLVIVPVVILVIGIFISVIVSMTGDILAARGSNALSNNIQDALNRIEQDVNSSSGYLATNNISLTSPQGYNDGTTSFKNVGTNGTMLILNSYATTSNPLSSSQNTVYTPNPNPCNSTQVNQNPPVMVNIIYFVKGGTLWRRVVAPYNYATIGCSVPWQQPSCTPGYATPSFCKTQDTRLVDNMQTNGFSVNYFSNASSISADTTASDSSQPDNIRQTALQSDSTVGITINAAGTIAGRNVSQSGTLRAVSPNNTIRSIVTNGLVMNLDAGNPISYPGSGNVWTDISGNGNNGILYGGVTYNAANGGTMTFDGTSGYVNVTNSSSISPSTGNISTLSCFKASTAGTLNGSMILNKESEYEISAGGGVIDYAFRPNWAWAGATSFNVSQYYCLAVTYDQSYQRMYINGTQVYSAPLSGPIGNLFSNDLRIGARGAPGAASAFFNGQIATVQIYNRALTAAEVQQNFNAFSSRYNYQYVKVLVVAGGGGGATDIDVGGGGGGGGLLTGSLPLSAQSYPVTVGAGGARGTGPDNTGVGGGTNGTQGGNSIFSSMTAIGGGYGGTRSQPGGSGGSGGGGGDSSQPGGLGTSGQGYNGGAGPGMNTQSGNDSGGGGGAGGAASYNTPGVGLFSSIGNATFAKGGRGAQLISPADGAANTGDGGTGARAGGSGVVIISYPTGSISATGGTITTSGGYTIHKFTSNSTFIVN